MLPQQYSRFFAVEEKHWWFAGMRDIFLAQLEKFYGGIRNLKILDVGCGTGLSGKSLEKFGQVTSTDIQGQALRLCADRGIRRLCQADAVELPFKNASFDLVSAFSLAEHVDDDAALIAELCRVCKAGGRVILSTSAFNFLWSRHDLINGHKRRYTAGSLKKLINSQGMEIEKLTYINFILFPFIWMAIVFSNIFKPLQPGAIENYYSLKGPLNKMLRNILRIESVFLSRLNAPFGVSLLCLAKKNAN